MTEKRNHRNDEIAYSTNVHCTVCDESRAKHKIAICKTIQLKSYFSRYFICIITSPWKPSDFVSIEKLYFFVFWRGFFCIWSTLFNVNFKKNIMILKVFLLSWWKLLLCCHWNRWRNAMTSEELQDADENRICL